MSEIDKLIEALDCSIRPYLKKDCDCSKCKYEYLERVNDSIPVPADTEKNGVRYWQSCDCDQMVKDAIQTIKELQEESKKLKSDLSWARDSNQMGRW